MIGFAPLIFGCAELDVSTQLTEEVDTLVAHAFLAVAAAADDLTGRGPHGRAFDEGVWPDRLCSTLLVAADGAEQSYPDERTMGVVRECDWPGDISRTTIVRYGDDWLAATSVVHDERGWADSASDRRQGMLDTAALTLTPDGCLAGTGTGWAKAAASEHPQGKRPKSGEATTHFTLTFDGGNVAWEADAALDDFSRDEFTVGCGLLGGDE